MAPTKRFCVFLKMNNSSRFSTLFFGTEHLDKTLLFGTEHHDKNCYLEILGFQATPEEMGGVHLNFNEDIEMMSQTDFFLLGSETSVPMILFPLLKQIRSQRY